MSGFFPLDPRSSNTGVKSYNNIGLGSLPVQLHQFFKFLFFGFCIPFWNCSFFGVGVNFYLISFRRKKTRIIEIAVSTGFYEAQDE